MSVSTARPGLDALWLLTADHESIERLFAEAGGASTDDARAGLAVRICRALTVHVAIEEELLYPVASRVLTDERLVRQAEVEHATVKEIVRRFASLVPSDLRFGPTLKVLEEHVRHHVVAQEQDLFPRLRRAPLDRSTLGPALAQRRRELAGRLGAAPEPLDGEPGQHTPSATARTSPAPPGLPAQRGEPYPEVQPRRIRP